MKKITLLLLMLFSIGFLQAQKIEFKNGLVYIYGKQCLKYDNSDPNNILISTLDESQTIFLKYIRVEVCDKIVFYSKIIFVEPNKSFEAMAYNFTKRLLIQKLLKNEVLGLSDCTFDFSKLDRFILRYEEDISKNIINTIIIKNE